MDLDIAKIQTAHFWLGSTRILEIEMSVRHSTAWSKIKKYLNKY